MAHKRNTGRLLLQTSGGREDGSLYYIHRAHEILLRTARSKVMMIAEGMCSVIIIIMVVIIIIYCP